MQESSTTTKSNIDSAVESGNNVTQASDIVRIPSITRLALAQQKQIISLTNHDSNKNNNDIDNADQPPPSIQESSTAAKSNIDSAVESNNKGIQASDIVRIDPITRLALEQKKTNYVVNEP